MKTLLFMFTFYDYMNVNFVTVGVPIFLQSTHCVPSKEIFICLHLSESVSMFQKQNIRLTQSRLEFCILTTLAVGSFLSPCLVVCECVSCHASQWLALIIVDIWSVQMHLLLGLQWNCIFFFSILCCWLLWWRLEGNYQKRVFDFFLSSFVLFVTLSR